MKMKGPFSRTDENLYFVPSKPGVFLLGDEDGKVIGLGRAEKDLAQSLKNALESSQGRATRFWYWDTWSRQEAMNLSGRLSQKYQTQSDALAAC